VDGRGDILLETWTRRSLPPEDGSPSVRLDGEPWTIRQVFSKVK
jgi:hypothetical protein